jgi:hypothetical protein
MHWINWLLGKSWNQQLPESRYSELRPDLLMATLRKLELRIAERFPEAGLVKVCKDLTALGEYGNKIYVLLRQPIWPLRILTSMSIIALMLQFTALLLAPLILVQPIGAAALVITSVVNAKITKTKLNKASILAVLLCTAGLGAFVVMAHEVSVEPVIDDSALMQILTMAISLIGIFSYIFFSGASRFKPLTFIIGAGVLYGFVATLTKVVVKRLFSQDGFNRLISFQGELLTDGLTVLALISMVAAGLLGGWFVQNAYASGPPDLVIAGLTVIDPLIAVSIGVVLLNEAMDAPWPIMLGFIFSGAMAVVGVFLLSKVHPEVNKA